MATLPNATNSAPGTTYSGSGGGLAAGIQVPPLNPGNSIVSDTITSSQDPYNGTNVMGVFNSVDGWLSPLQVGGNMEVQATGNSASTALWRTLYASDGVIFMAQDSGTSFPYIEVNKTVNGGEAFTGVALLNISSINGAAPGGGLTTVNVSTANVKGAAVQVDPNTTTVIGSDSLPSLPTGSNILIQATIGLGGLTGSNVTGHVQYGVGFSNATPIFCPPIYINTNDPITISSIQISGILNNVSTTNTLLLIGSNAANNSLLYTAELASLSLTPL